MGSISETSNTLVRFFNPRIDVWSEHFHINENAEIESLTEIGEVTVFIFGFNEPERIDERKGLIELGLY